MSKKQLKELEKLLKLAQSQDKATSTGSANDSSPKNILGLISKCEKLISQIDSSDAGLIQELLLTISKLRIIILSIFKTKQRKLVNLHWEQIQDESAKAAKKLTKQIEQAKKQQNAKGIFSKAE